mgnify:CR=1 FL=1
MSDLRIIINKDGDILIAVPLNSGLNQDSDCILQYKDGRLSCIQDDHEVFGFNVGSDNIALFATAHEKQKIFLWEASASGIVVHDKIRFE